VVGLALAQRPFERDERLREQLLILARDLYARPQTNLPQACQTRARTKAAYRFFDRPDTSTDALLGPHFEATQQRIVAESLVFALQDATRLNLRSSWSLAPRVQPKIWVMISPCG
jgi:hypothetical protein